MDEYSKKLSEIHAIIKEGDELYGKAVIDDFASPVRKTKAEFNIHINEIIKKFITNTETKYDAKIKENLSYLEENISELSKQRAYKVSPLYIPAEEIVNFFKRFITIENFKNYLTQAESIKTAIINKSKTLTETEVEGNIEEYGAPPAFNDSEPNNGGGRRKTRKNKRKTRGRKRKTRGRKRKTNRRRK